MRGRKPQPTVLKIAAGVRKSRIPTGEPRSSPGSLSPPKSLTKKLAIEHWNEVAPVLKEMGLLTEANRFGLALLCEEYAHIHSLPMSKTGTAKDRYRKMLCEFGLTPSSVT